jgi:archaellum component FlaC
MFGFKTPRTMPQEQHIHVHIEQDHSVAIQITQINNKLERIMATFDEINAKLDTLQAALDNEQAQIASAIAGLEQTILDLQSQIANGATPEQLQAVADKLTAIQTDLEGTIPDAPAETPA